MLGSHEIRGAELRWASSTLMLAPLATAGAISGVLTLSASAAGAGHVHHAASDASCASTIERTLNSSGTHQAEDAP